MTVGRTPNYDRLDILWGICYLLTSVLFLRLFQVQVVQNVEYTRAAERNRTQLIRQTAPRGRIYDRNGDVLASNQAAFSLIYKPGKNVDENTLSSLADHLGPLLRTDRELLLDRLRKAVREESAIRLAENLPTKAMFKLSELKTIYPGVDLIVEARRFYTYGASAAHLIGYLGKMDERSWKDYKSQGYRVDSRIGKTGLEKIFERELKGLDGGIRMEVDAQGRLRRRLEKLDPKAGSNIHLTIDGKLQRVAEDALRKSPSGQGAVVVLDVRNGDVLALASIPDFDPNQFMDPESTAPIKALPEFNLATQGTYAPGSTFKIITGAAMLNEGRVDPNDKVYCPGYFDLGNHRFNCWEKRGHKYMNWWDGLANSCDVYFWRMGLRAGGDLIEKYERMFGLGQRTNLGLPGERRGYVFGPENRKARKLSWHDGDTCNLSIGQGELLVTPIQLAVMMVGVANRGTMWRPHFLSRIEYADGRPEWKQRPEEIGRIELKPQSWAWIDEALTQAVKAGTGGKVYTPGIHSGGKTGTAQNPQGDDNAWFVAYSGREEGVPEIAFAVLVQHGGHGSDAATPIARRLVHTYFGVGEAAPKPVAISSGTTIVPAVGTLIRDIRPPRPPVVTP
ncbi:MAG: penicillin-binding protein 2 [Elusimicrobia bacterium]|nr:penicillin-binding protein 2 [Elusimicrobiota bacterium]